MQKAFMNFATMAAIAAVTVTQLLRARDNPGGQSLLDAFDAEDKQVIEAICADYEGPKSQLTPDPTRTPRGRWPAPLGCWRGWAAGQATTESRDPAPSIEDSNASRPSDMARD